MTRNTRDKLTLDDALLGGPGLDGYAFQADVYCVPCGRHMIREVFGQYPEGIEYPFCQDTDTLPQPIFFGESDTEQHCGECGEYLYGELAEDEQETVDTHNACRCGFESTDPHSFTCPVCGGDLPAME